MRNVPAFIALAVLILPPAAAAAPARLDAAAFGPAALFHPFPDHGTAAPAGITLSGGYFDAGSTWGVDSDPGFNTLVLDTLTLTLDRPVRAIGFAFGSNRATDAVVSVGRQGGGLVDFQLSVSADDAPADGIDTLIFSGNLAAVGLFSGIGDLRTLAGPTAVAAVPEPASMALFAVGLAALGGMMARRRRR